VTELAAPSRPADFRAGDVLSDTWTLYKRLFGRSAFVALAVVLPLRLIEQLASHNVVAGLLSVVVLLVGTAFVQGALVELVEDEHEGRPARSLGVIYASAADRVLPLLGLSILVGLYIGLGLLLFVVPGLILMTRFAVAVPALVLEDRSIRDSMRRSRELVRGHGGAIFWLFFCVGVLTGAVQLLLVFGAVLLGGGQHIPILIFLAGLCAAALTTPYAAHALNAAYYRLAEPELPVLPERADRRWESVWQAERGLHESEPESRG